MKPTETANEIMQTIGLISLLMIGANQYEYYENGLSFRIYGSKKFNHIKICINPYNDEYFDMVFTRFCSKSDKAIETISIEGVVFDELCKIITKQTDLFTQIL